MAQKGVQLDRETFSCSICLDLLKDPVTTTCGHSYCMKCIKGFWDGEDEKNIHSCPQCMQSFTPRPVLLKNSIIAALVEELKKTGPPPAPADLCNAGAEDVSALGGKRKALDSCLQCVVSYCEKHLQPNYESPAFKKHKLMEPSKKLQESMYSRHEEVKKMFCRTDQQSICYLCSVDEHKGHDTVSAAAERTERQRELEGSRLNIQQRIQDGEKEVKLLQQEVEAVNGSADKAVEDSEKMFTELIRLMEKRSSDVKQQLRSQQKSDIRPLSYIEDVTAALSAVRDKLQDVLREEWTNAAEPTTRAGFLKYSQEITLDPNTANTMLVLSEGSRKATVMEQEQSYSRHPDRFTYYSQVLSRESLTGRCYWEVEWTGRDVCVAVAYKNIIRAGRGQQSLFGENDKSWSLDCDEDSYSFSYKKLETPVSGPLSYRVGVYLDHRAGILSFYSVSETMTLLHRVQTTFTQPLHAGVWVGYHVGATTEFCKLK